MYFFGRYVEQSFKQSILETTKESREERGEVDRRMNPGLKKNVELKFLILQEQGRRQPSGTGHPVEAK